MECKKFIMSGNVQGVGFRWSAKTKADELEITGHARNLGNGTVEIIACGEPIKLDIFENWFKNEGGPSYSSIDKILVQQVKIELIPLEFEVL